jgi:hypothetical protein
MTAPKLRRPLATGRYCSTNQSLAITHSLQRKSIMDSYQAIYDAVSQRIGRPDVERAIVEATRGSFDISHAVAMIQGEISGAVYDWQMAARDAGRPFVLLKPRIFIDQGHWCALYGENLQDGVAGFGDSPELASREFDKNWAASSAPIKGAEHG